VSIADALKELDNPDVEHSGYLKNRVDFWEVVMKYELDHLKTRTAMEVIFTQQELIGKQELTKS
jgi:hypothetical protein